LGKAEEGGILAVWRLMTTLIVPAGILISILENITSPRRGGHCSNGEDNEAKLKNGSEGDGERVFRGAL